MKSCQSGAILYIFEDNEAVIWMIIKGRSPTMRHVSRTHRVALDWSFDRINLDAQTKSNMLTPITNSQTCWQRAMSHVMSGTIFSICSSSAFFSSASCPEATSKIMQKGTGEERIVAKSKPTLNLVSRHAASPLTAPSSSASSRPGILRAPSQQDSNLTAQCAGEPCAGGSNQNDSASSSQVWLTDARLRERARKLASGNLPLKFRYQRRGRLEWPHNLRISRAYVPDLEKVNLNLRQQLKRKPEDKMEDLDVNTLIWRMFMSVTQQAAVHLGYDYLDNVHSIKNQPQRTVKQLIDRWNEQVGQRTYRNIRDIPYRLTRKFPERDDSVDWPSSSAVNSESLCILQFCIEHGKKQWKSSKRMEGENW